MANGPVSTVRKDSVRSDPGLTAPISPAPQVPANSAVISSLLEDLTPFFDDGSAGLQRLIARMPLLLEVDRAYVARISPDGVRFTVTQASRGNFPDLLGYTQSVARMPAFARGCLKTGVQATIDDALTFPFTPQQRKMLWYGGLRGTVVTPIRSNGVWVGALVVDVLKQQRIWDFLVLDACRMLAGAIGARLALAKLGDHLISDESDAAPDNQHLNVIANLANLLETSNDPGATSAEIVDALAGLTVGALGPARARRRRGRGHPRRPGERGAHRHHERRNDPRRASRSLTKANVSAASTSSWPAPR